MIRIESAHLFLHGWPPPLLLLAADTHGWHPHQPSSQRISAPVNMNRQYFVTFDMSELRIFDMCQCHNAWKYWQGVVFSGDTPAGTPSWPPLWRIPLPAHRQGIYHLVHVIFMSVGDRKTLSVKKERTWMTSKLAAPALPTLIVMGLTSALLAKFWIFLGIVALKSRVCLCP